ncbi:MAG TPA: NADH-quinone oxidoreductase subunit NuoK [Planctomycetota bacterium]|nr:NADH-quinone oxidoreductase subunit NuoK [Planctomycetota bacterium]
MAEFGPDALAAYIAVAAVLFAAGVLAVATRRSAIGVLVGLDLMLNAGALQFVAYGRFRRSGIDVQGQTAAVFVIVVAAAEAAIALALLFAVYRTSKDVDLEQTRELRS